MTNDMTEVNETSPRQ